VQFIGPAAEGVVEQLTAAAVQVPAFDAHVSTD
jgi:hypothetical protein